MIDFVGKATETTQFNIWRISTEMVESIRTLDKKLLRFQIVKKKKKEKKIVQ